MWFATDFLPSFDSWVAFNFSNDWATVWLFECLIWKMLQSVVAKRYRILIDSSDNLSFRWVLIESLSFNSTLHRGLVEMSINQSQSNQHIMNHQVIHRNKPRDEVALLLSIRRDSLDRSIDQTIDYSPTSCDSTQSEQDDHTERQSAIQSSQFQMNHSTDQQNKPSMTIVIEDSHVPLVKPTPIHGCTPMLQQVQSLTSPSSSPYPANGNSIDKPVFSFGHAFIGMASTPNMSTSTDLARYLSLDALHSAMMSAMLRQTSRVSIGHSQFTRSTLGMFARKSFAVNELLLIEDPVIQASSDASRCEHCSIALSSTLIRCLHCLQETYCGEECRKKATANHLRACCQKWATKDLKQQVADRSTGLSLVDLMLLKLLSRSSVTNVDSKGAIVCRLRNIFQANQWLLTIPPPAGQPSSLSWTSYFMLCTLANLTKLDLEHFTYQTCAYLHRTLSHSVAALKTDQQLVRCLPGFGCALYESCSLIRRSHTPNVVAVVRPDRYGNSVCLVATRPIKQGEEIQLEAEC